MKTVPAAEANRSFSRLLNEVENGASVRITSRGRPVARLIPEPVGELDAREEAKRRYLDELRDRPAQNLGPFTRDDAYEDGYP